MHQVWPADIAMNNTGQRLNNTRFAKNSEVIHNIERLCMSQEPELFEKLQNEFLKDA